MPSGGARKGAGRKPYSMDEQMRKGVIKAYKKRAKETGISFGDLLMNLVYGAEKEKDRIKASELFMNLICPKKSQVEIEDKTIRPTIYLPEKEEKPQGAVEFEERFQREMQELTKH